MKTLSQFFPFPFNTPTQQSSLRGLSSVSRGGGCNSRLSCYRSFFSSLLLFLSLSILVFIACLVGPCRPLFFVLFPVSFAFLFAESHSFNRSCVLSSKVSSPLALRVLC